MNHIKEMLSKVNFDKIYLVLVSVLAFAAPLSWKATRTTAILIILTRILQPNLVDFIKQVRQSKFLTALVLFSSYQLTTLLWTETPYEVEHVYTRGYLLWFAIPIVALSLQVERIRTVITIFLFSMIVSQVAAYGMYFDLWTINGRGSENPSPFIYHTDYSMFLAVATIILLNRLYSQIYSIPQKIILGVFFVTTVGNLFISLGRIGQLSFAVAIMVAGILHYRFRLKTLFVSVFFIATIFVAAYQASPVFQHRVAMGVSDIENIRQGDLNTSWGIRVAYILLGTEIIKENPIIGVGIGDVLSSAREYVEREKFDFLQDEVKAFIKNGFHFHNEYLMVAIQSGIVGLILFFAMFYWYFFLPIKDVEIKQLSLLFGIILLVGFVADPFITFGDSRALFLLFAPVFAAASLRCAQEAKACA